MNKIEKSINRIRYLKDKGKVKLAFSGGKDSVVLYDLAKRSGIEFTSVYQNTTIDPPGTIQFIKQNFPDVIIRNPNESFYQMVQKYGLPNRFQRWCCDKLKKYDNKGYKYILIGIRREESSKRSNYNFFKKEKDYTTIYPIIDWTDKDIWNYIKDNNLPILKYYMKPYYFVRHGCVMCPLANPKQRIRDAKLFPKHLKALIKAVKKYRETHQHLEFVKKYRDEYQMVYLWLQDKLNTKGLYDEKNRLFDIDYKKELEKLTGIDL